MGAVMRILKDRGFLVGGDEEETAAAMKGLRGYKDDVLRSYGEGLWEEFWRHGRPAPIVKASCNGGGGGGEGMESGCLLFGLRASLSPDCARPTAAVSSPFVILRVNVRNKTKQNKPTP